MPAKHSKKNQKQSQQRRIAGYGWIPDLPDDRDYLFGVRRPVAAAATPTPSPHQTAPTIRRYPRAASLLGIWSGQFLT